MGVTSCVVCQSDDRRGRRLPDASAGPARSAAPTRGRRANGRWQPARKSASQQTVVQPSQGGNTGSNPAGATTLRCTGGPGVWVSKATTSLAPPSCRGTRRWRHARPVLQCAEQLPKGVVCAMRGVDLSDRPTPQLPHRVLEVVSQDGEGSTHTRFTAGSQAVGVGATDLDRLGP